MATAEAYVPILVLAAVSTLLIFVTLLLPTPVKPRNPSWKKGESYESGEIPRGDGRGPMSIQYYLYVIVTLILAVEAIFLIPFAVFYDALTTFQKVAAIIFIVLLLDGWLYAAKRGFLEWAG